MKNPNDQITTDGLISLDSKIVDFSMHPTHTEIEVDIGRPEPMVTRTLTLTIRYFKHCGKTVYSGSIQKIVQGKKIHSK